MRRARWLIALCAPLVLAACSDSESAREAAAMKAALPQRLRPDGSIALSDGDRAALALSVTPVAEGEVPDVSLRYGRVRLPPGQQTQVVSPVAGRLAAPPKVALGQAVRAGELLLEVVPSLAAAERISVGVQAAQLAGQLEAAQSQLATDEAALARARELAASKIVSEARLQQAETAVAATRAKIEALRRAAGTQHQGEGAPLALRAPVDGVVATLDTDVGAAIRQGDLLVRLLRPGPRWVDVFAPADEPPGSGYQVAPRASARAGAWLAARLLSPGEVLEDDGTRHDRLEVGADQAAGLLFGQTVSVRVAHGTGRGLVIPEAALVPALPLDRVFVETEPNVFRPTPVRVAARFGGWARIASGLKAGDKVVVAGTMALEGERRRSELRQAD